MAEIRQLENRHDVNFYEHRYSTRMVGEIKEGKIGTATNKQ